MFKIGIIGLGFISHEHVLGYLNNPHAEIVAICDSDQQRARQWQQKWNLSNARCFRDLDTMLSAASLDIVEILTPHGLHCEHAVACSRAKVKGISLQKPMAASLAECDRVIDACRANNVVLQIYENYLFYPAYQQAKELIDDGIIGELISVRIHTVGGLREGASWPKFWDPSSDLLDVNHSGNSPLVGDDGLHKFALASWLMQRDISQVGAWIDQDTPLDAPAFIRVRFQSDRGETQKYAQLDFTFSTTLSIPCDFWLDDFVEICGHNGMMWINQCAAAGDRALFAGNEMSSSPLFPPIVVFVDGKVTPFMDGMSLQERNWSHSFRRCTQHFIDVMRNNSKPSWTGEDGKKMIRCAQASLLSAQEHRDVNLDEVTSEAEASGQFKLHTNFCNRKEAEKR